MKKLVLNFLKLLVLPVTLFFVFSISTEGFGWHSIPIVLSQCAIPAVLGFGMVLIMNAGLMDFSIGARALFSAVLGGLLARDYGVVGLLAGCFGGGLLGAALMGALYYILRIPSLVVSLGIVLIYEVLGAKITGTTGFLRITPDQYAIASFPYNVILMLIAAIICYVIIYKTKTGSSITAVGNDELMCRNVGIKADAVKFKAFVLSGIFCGFGSLFIICFSGSVSATTDMSTMNMIFKPLMCLLIGGQMRKYIDNTPLLIIIASISFAVIFNGFIALGFTDALQNIVLGLFLICVISFSANSAAFENWRRRRALRRASPAYTDKGLN